MTQKNPPGSSATGRVAPLAGSGLRSRRAASRGRVPDITVGGRPAGLSISRESLMMSPYQDNFSADEKAAMEDLTAVIEILDYIEIDVERFEPSAAIDVRRANARLRHLVELITDFKRGGAQALAASLDTTTHEADACCPADGTAR